MKLNKDELKNKISELVTDNDISIQLLEDVEDSMLEEDTSKLDDLQAKFDVLQNKYKERFLSGENIPKIEENKPELEEKEYIDIKEI